MRILKPIIFLYLLLFPCISFSELECKNAFAKLYYEFQVLKQLPESRKVEPTGVNFVKDIKLSKLWNLPPSNPKVPEMLNALLPEGVHLLRYQLYKPATQTTIKLRPPTGYTIMGRASFPHPSSPKLTLHTNVAFSIGALVDNMETQKNWLAGAGAKAVILYLHGGGTKSTGAHTAVNMINHYHNLGIHVVAVDLPYHGQGPRDLLSLEGVIKMLGSFARKYLPPHVPLFVAGHSWGALFAEQLMRMTEQPDFHFHKSLSGAIILSNAFTGATPNTPREVIYENYTKILDEVNTSRQNEAADMEKGLWEEIIRRGKYSLLGSSYATKIILEALQYIPEHKGKKFIPALMLVGEYDPLVFLGFEKLYREYYEGLENVEAHFLDTLPYKLDRNRKETKVGHIIQDFLTTDKKEGMQDKLITAFIEKQLTLFNIKTAKENVAGFIEQSLLKQNQLSLEELNSQGSFGEIKHFIEANPHVQSHSPDNITNLKQNIDRLEERVQLSASKKVNIPTYFRIVQEYANNLAFRNFLRDFEFMKDQKVLPNFNLAMDKLRAINQKVVTLLLPYSNPQLRIAFWLTQLSEVKDFNKLNSLKGELNYLTSPDHLNKIRNKKIKDILLSLKDQITTAIPSQEESSTFKLNGHNSLPIITETALRTLNEHLKPEFKKLQNSSQTKKPVHFVNNLLKLKDIESIEKEIASYQLPDTVNKKLLQLINEHLENDQIINSLYVPEWTELKNMATQNHPDTKKRGAQLLQDLLNNLGIQIPEKTESLTEDGEITPKVLTYLQTTLQKMQAEFSKTKNQALLEHVNTALHHINALVKEQSVYNRIQNDHTALETIVNNRIELLELRNKLQIEMDKHKKTHNSLIIEVEQSIKTIKEALEAIFDNPPHSLIKEVQKHQQNFEQTILPAQIKMAAAVEKEFALIAESQPEQMNAEEVMKIFEKHMPDINHFEDVFSYYVQNAKTIRKNAITAMENGEMGKELKEAVIKLYGKNSQGNQPIVGSNSRYRRLEATIETLAELESSITITDRKILENRMEYYQKLSSIANLINNDQKNKKIAGIQLASQMSLPSIIVAKDILDETTNNKDELKKLLPEINPILSDILKKWHDAKSTLPPFLPTNE